MEEQLQRKLEIASESSFDDFSKTFIINLEDHTLANALRYLVMKNPDVLFCGYTIPHPSELKVNFRIQTNKKITALEALEKGLVNLNAQCAHVIGVFEQSVSNFEKDQQVQMEC